MWVKFLSYKKHILKYNTNGRGGLSSSKGKDFWRNLESFEDQRWNPKLVENRFIEIVEITSVQRKKELSLLLTTASHLAH